ncbi:uncharacterized protein BP5553_00535 [Venustampulla echinocandica]|uniref:Uncharacterized protein n=1 Tax=Venustampulla echinocandica TaxID=2656787 RepID=A0A370TYE8_9HELO|nr:uncharacterized protein BP5553_00535 [Venustampulla echinocandica]RDL40556.1 hypothetical protein BP5553_00535 [Venustampulla echinocandica]
MNSIAANFAVCLADYEQLISIIAESSSPLHQQLELSALQDELGRFKVWAGNIAAHKTGRSSLDFRLRDATPLRERIMGLLSDMSELLEEGSQIAAGDRVPQDEAPSDHDSDSSDEEGSTLSVRSENLTTELQQIFLDVVVCIDCLYKLSMTIRSGVSAHDRLVKAAAIDISFYETWDIQHVKSKFPAIKESLATRLGKSISRRRQHFKYCEKHHKKLAQDLILPQRALNLPHPSPAIANSPGISPQDPSPVDNHQEVAIDLPRIEAKTSTVATTVLTQTTASEFVGGTTDFEVESDSGQTSTSYATTVSQGGRLCIPPPPRDSIGGRPFECPYCFTIVGIRTTHAWKKHVFRDLQPYVCTFETCAKASRMFDSRRDWFDHELINHRKEWFCTADCQQSFKVQGEFEDHMQDVHQISSPNQLSALVDMCQRPVDEDAEEQCPLCMETLGSMKQLCRHLARHLEELALFALPRSKDDEGVQEFDSDEPQVSDISRQLSDNSVTFGSNPDTIESLSDPDRIPDIDIPDNDDFDIDGTDGGDPALELLDLLWDSDATQTLILPVSFLSFFNQRLQNIIDGTDGSLEHQDKGFINLLVDLSKALASNNVQNQLTSKRGLSDLLLMVYLHARKCYQKQSSSDREVIWGGLVDRVRMFFIKIIKDIVIESRVQEENVSKLVDHLAAIETKLAARSQPDATLGGEREGFDVIPDQDWASYWDLKVSDMQTYPQEEVERQRAIHDIWLSEKAYVDRLVVCLARYHEDLVRDPSIMQNGKPFYFVEDGFTIIGTLQELHEGFLFALENRIKTQGPWVHDLSDIIRDWIPRTTSSYRHYAVTFPMIEWLIQREAAHNPRFKETFYSEAAKLDWLSCMKSPSIRIQQYLTLLPAIRQTASENTDEGKEFKEMMENVKTLTEGFQKMENYGRAKVRVHELNKALLFREGLGGPDLGLNDEGRHLLFEGQLERLRTAALGFSIANHAFLFDNYFVLAKRIGSHDIEKYDVSKPPIPMGLLVLQDAKDNSRISPIYSKIENSQSTTLEIQAPEEEFPRPGYSPFNIKHLGNQEAYTLLVKTEEERKEWCENIVLAKAAYAATLFKEKAEPFSLNVLSNGYFQNTHSLRLNRFSKIQGSPLSQAIQRAAPAPPHTRVRTGVKFGTTFMTENGPREVIGTKHAIFVLERGSSSSLPVSKLELPDVTQLLEIEELNIMLVLASKSIYSYPTQSFEALRLGQQITPAEKILENVEFFRLNKMESVRSGEKQTRILLFCAIRQEARTQIKVLELYASNIGKAKKQGAGFSFSPSSSAPHESSPLTSTPSVYKFRDYDEFYSAKDCYDIVPFRYSIAIMTGKGFDNMAHELPLARARFSRSLFTPTPFAEGQLPALGLFRLPEGMFWGRLGEVALCVYENFATYIDENGMVSERPPINFVGQAISATSYSTYLILFHDDFVEIRDMTTGKLCQIIAGQNIRYLEGDRDQGRNVMFVMAHPELEGRELVLELVLDYYHVVNPPLERPKSPVPRSRYSRIPDTASYPMVQPTPNTSRSIAARRDEDGAKKPPSKCTVS